MIVKFQKSSIPNMRKNLSMQNRFNSFYIQLNFPCLVNYLTLYYRVNFSFFVLLLPPLDIELSSIVFSYIIFSRPSSVIFRRSFTDRRIDDQFFVCFFWSYDFFFYRDYCVLHSIPISLNTFSIVVGVYI